jgi:cell division protein FtsB
MTNTALAAPAPRRAPAAEPRRHLEVAPTRAQRRARPRLVHVLVTLGGIGVILLGQLLLSIWIADGAYQVHSLQSQQVQLQRSQHALSEQLDQLGSPQSIAARAEQLGMVQSGNPAYLDLGTGAVSGTPSAGTTGIVAGTGDLVPNSLVAAGGVQLDPMPDAAATSGAATPGGGASSPTPTSPDDSVIPSPQTH